MQMPHRGGQARLGDGRLRGALRNPEPPRATVDLDDLEIVALEGNGHDARWPVVDEVPDRIGVAEGDRHSGSQARVFPGVELDAVNEGAISTAEVLDLPDIG